MQIDLHNISLEKSKEIIDKNIEYCLKNKINSLEIIHGFNNGTKIKNYLKKSKTLKEKYPSIINIQPNLLNPGKTIIYLKISI